MAVTESSDFLRGRRVLAVLVGWVLAAAALVVVVGVVWPAGAGAASGLVDEVRAVGDDPAVPGFPIDFVAVTWEAPDDAIDGPGHSEEAESHGAVRFRRGGVWGPWIGFVEEGAQAPGQWSSSLVAGGGAEAYQIRGVPSWAVSPRAIAIGEAASLFGVDGRVLALSSCVSRGEWGADESKRFDSGVEVWPPTFYSVQGLIVHHTVTANDDVDPAATVRAIYHQHAVLNGWGDIAYHYLIDEAGRVYEGRWSGEASQPCSGGGDGSDFAHNDAGELVTGGHTGYHNQGNVGVALLGNFASPAEYPEDPDWVQVDPKAAALEALQATLADLSMRHDIDPLGDFVYANPMCDLPSDQWEWDCDDAGLPYFPGQVRNLISGHRDWRATACPGAALYALLGDVRSDVAASVADRPVITVTDDPLTAEGDTTGGYQGPLSGVSATHPEGDPVTLTNDAPALLALGDTTVTWTATDPHGLYDLATQTVIVTDTTPPQASVPDAVVVAAEDATGAVATYTATVSDIVDPAPTIQCTPTSGSRFPVGTTAVSCTAADASGNQHEASFEVTVTPRPHTVGLVDPTQGRWHLYDANGVEVAVFFYGNPGDIPFMGDWDCDGVDTPGLFRQSDAFAYLRNSNTQGIADIRFFFGNPSDIPLAGDFNGDGCDTLSLYRPSTQEFFIINKLGENEGGLGAADFSFFFGNPGDKPVVGDWDGDGIDEVGLHREATGFFYWRNTLTTGIADGDMFFGDPGDRFVAGDWGIVDGIDTPAVFRPSNTTMFFRHTLTQGIADSQFVAGQSGWLPVAGDFGLG